MEFPSHQRAPTQSVLSLDELVPAKAVISAFEQRGAPMLKKALRNLRNTSTLTSLAESLLPMLVSGRVGVEYRKDTVTTKPQSRPDGDI